MERLRLVASIMYCTLYAITDDAVYTSVSHVFVTLIASSALSRNGNPTRIALDACLVFVVIPPYIYDALVGNSKYGIIVALSYILIRAYEFKVRRAVHVTGFPAENDYSSKSLIRYLWFLLLIGTLFSSAWGGADDETGTLYFFIPFTCSLLFFESFCRTSRRMFPVLLGVALYVAAVVAFIVLYWDGFGRLLIGSYFLLPLLVAGSYHDFRLRSWQVGLCAPILLIVAHRSRFDAGNDISQDSGSGHYIVTMDMINSMGWRPPRGWQEFFEQWQLLFLQWVPRAWWPNKPIGLGSSFVDDWLGRYGYSEGHSIATGFLGEQMWLLGHWFLIGIVIYLITILMLRAVVVRLSGFFYTPVLTFDVLLTTYFWGGGASFSARVLVAIIPMLLITMIFAAWHKSRNRLPTFARQRVYQASMD